MTSQSIRCVLPLPNGTQLVSVLRKGMHYPVHSSVGLHIQKRLDWEMSQEEDLHPKITNCVGMCVCRACWVVKPWFYQTPSSPFCVWCRPHPTIISKILYQPEEAYNEPHIEPQEIFV